MATLYIVGTPIGNREDITLRALRVLGDVGLIAAEDTRHTGRLLKHYDIATPLVSYHEHNETERTPELLARLETTDLALVADAGMPTISDPGYRLVAAAAAAGFPVVPIPGPTAVSAALAAGGLPTDSFLFLGFLPRREQARREALQQVARLPYTLILYEAPQRLTALLADVLAVLGDRPVAVCRELTKLHEEIRRGPAGEMLAYFQAGEVKGEVTVVIGGAPAQSGEPWTDEAVIAAVQTLIAEGVPRKEAAGQVAEASGRRKRDVYQLSLTQPSTS
jgi:16S rRNA (cytidine1402-2'-O)-methyltransferase